MKKLKIAIIGGGIFGVTTAYKLAEQGHRVDLYEAKANILQAASGINQYRIHRGYHYPRSSETAITSIAGEASFRKEYRSAIINETFNFYCLAKKNSKTEKKQYLEFLKKHNLEYILQRCPVINQKHISLSIIANECLIDPDKLREISWKKLKSRAVKVYLNSLADENIFKKYEKIIIATYAHINKSLQTYKKHNQDYQYELCEKIVVELPVEFKNLSVVILDGPFMCIDPLGRTGYFLLGNVVHAIHQTNVGKIPKYSKKFKSLLDNGLITDPPVTNFKKFIESSEQFFPKIKYAKHIGSMYTFRAVLPNKEDTDERLTTIKRVNNQIYTIFSGKIVSCVDAADKLTKIVQES